MKILIITNNYTPYSGGVVSSINATISQLRKLGHSVQLVTLNFLGDHTEDPDFVRRVPSLIRFRYKTNHIAVPHRPKNFLRKIMGTFQPDIVHVHHPFLLGYTAKQLAKKYNIPVVLTYHTQYEQFPLYVPVPQSWIAKFIVKKVVTFCNDINGIIAVGPIVQKFLSQQKIKVPSIQLASSLQEHFLKPFKPKEHCTPFRLLLISRFSKEKNIPFLLDVFAQLPKNSFTFTLVGFGPLYNSIKQYATKLNLSGVYFIHKPAKEKLVELYHNAHLFLFSAQQSECQPQVLPEAFSAGLPIIALPGPGPDECIKNGYNGFIVKTKEEMVDRIKHVAQDDQLYKTLRYNAWQSAQTYHPEKIVKQLIHFYKSVQF